MKNKDFKKTNTSVAVINTALALSLIASGCSKSNSGPGTIASGTPVSLSGKIANVSSSSARVSNRHQLFSSMKSDLNTFSNRGGSSLLVNLSTYHIHCATSDAPPVETNGTMSADGSFSFDVASALGKALSCDVLDSGNNTIASFTLKDTSKKDMNGNSQVNNTPAFASNSANLGSVTMDMDAGDVVIPTSQVTDGNGKSALGKSSSESISNPFDPSGSWTITDIDFTLPKGVSGTCAAGNHDNGCNGPPQGMKLYLNRLKGIETSDGSTVYGMQVWQDESTAGDARGKMASCGDMTGLSAADAAHAGVDLSSYGALNGGFKFASTVTDNGTTATLTDGYKLSTAKAQYTMQACVPKDIISGSETYHTYVCGPDTFQSGGSPGGRYNASLGGGCYVTSTGVAVSNLNYNNVSWGSCTTSAGTLPGFYKNSCTATYNSTTAITCTNEWGIFNDSALTSAAPSPGGGNAPYFNYAGVATLMTQNQNCSTISDALTQVRCYADYYQQHVSNFSGCLPKVQTDWSSNDASSFVKVDFRPQSLVFMEKLSYANSTSASMLTEQNQNWGVQVQDHSGNTQWVNCGVVDKGGLSFKQVSENKLLVTYTSSTTTTSNDKPACVGASWNGQKQKFLFYLVK